VRALTLIVGLTLAPAALAYGAGTGTATPASHVPEGAHGAKTARKPSKAQKLRKTLAACKREKTEGKRKSCEAKAKKLYGAKRGKGAKAREGTNKIELTYEGGEAGAGTGAGTTTAGAGTAAGGAGTTTGAAGTTTGAANEAEELQKAGTVGAPTPAGVEAGKKLFAEQCAGCHGTTGMGGDGGPNLNTLPRAHSVMGVIEQLIAPEGPMPDFDKVLSFQQKEALADFVTVEITHVAQG
jgi:mono/diheme cytochrome c family protein